MKRLIVLSLLALFCASGSVWGQSKKQDKARQSAAIAQEVARLINSKRYAFQATRSSNSSYGAMTEHNRLNIDNDKMSINLPYTGTRRAYEANTGNPLQFTSTDFTYAVEVNKKGVHTITIETAAPGSTNRLKMTLRFTTQGLGTLMISGSETSTVSFTGVIAPLAEPKKKK